jgi:hypothetical protein
MSRSVPIVLLSIKAYLLPPVYYHMGPSKVLHLLLHRIEMFFKKVLDLIKNELVK